MTQAHGTDEMRTTESETERGRDLLDDFYAWAKSVGHYHATEAVERYRTIHTSKGDRK